ncbi:nuclear transport factor 2 family protein [Pseudomaricurvus sp.]|uniref:nuclear transport factor 2 family protein n=1 Tax=Pseudomaricurvus sp. TaxID=2004510 RepID=UPI003F6CC1DA
MNEMGITNLVYRCAGLLESGELELAAELFASARVRLAADEAYLTHQQLLLAWQQKNPIGGEVQYLIMNPIVDVDADALVGACRSRYLILRGGEGSAPEILETGIYDDEFEWVDGYWQFASRTCTRLSRCDESPQPVVVTAVGAGQQDDTNPTRVRILKAAQQVFSTVGYSEAGIRKIADVVGLSPTILFRHFGTKAALYEEALIAAMGDPKPEPPVSRSRFGEHVASLLADPNQINCPHAMTVLASGNEEAREIAIRVLKQYALEPMMKWLGEPHAESRAREIMALCAGFALYNVQLNTVQPRQIDTHMVQWLAGGIQAIVDGSQE